MKTRKDRIIKGCLFVAELVRLDKTGSNIFKAAARKLVKLLTDEISGESEEMSDESVETLFTTPISA